MLVYDTPGQHVAPEVRAGWLREIHPGVDVRVIPDDPAIAQGDYQGLGRQVVDFLADERVDVLFTSEAYGADFAQAIGAEHFDVDRERVMVPITGTMVRRDPVAALAWLEPPVHAYYVPRVCIAGAESTGKTTLCERLAAHYGALWVPEYGRDYSLEKARNGQLGRWIGEEFVHIAFEQQRLEDDLARRSSPLLVCDTDALATRIWYEFYLGREPERWPLPPSKIDLYLIPFPDVPFVADEIRDGEHKRYWMHARFEAELAKAGRQFVVLRGTYEERTAQAIAAIDELLTPR